MSSSSSGCCCGIIIGVFLTLFIAVTGTVAVYCWINPEARKASTAAAAKYWQEFKNFGDTLINSAQTSNAPPAEPGLDQ